MTTGAGSQHYRLDARYIGDSDDGIDCLVPAEGGMKRVIIPVAEEVLGEWRGATSGKKIQVQVSKAFAEAKGIGFGEDGGSRTGPRALRG